jgi:hypothetical protein
VATAAPRDVKIEEYLALGTAVVDIGPTALCPEALAEPGRAASDRSAAAAIKVVFMVLLQFQVRLREPTDG